MNIKRNINEKTIASLEALAGERLSLGGLLKSIRQGEEMTQPEFSSLLGVSKQYLCDIEKARRFISPKQAVLYAKKLGYGEEQFVRLCLQDIINRDGLSCIVSVKAA